MGGMGNGEEGLRVNLKGAGLNLEGMKLNPRRLEVEAQKDES